MAIKIKFTDIKVENKNLTSSGNLNRGTARLLMNKLAAIAIKPAMQKLAETFALELQNTTTINALLTDAYTQGLIGIEDIGSEVDKFLNLVRDIDSSNAFTFSVVTGKNPRVQFQLYGQDFVNMIFEQTPLPWGDGVSWVDAIENGLNVRSHFLTGDTSHTPTPGGPGRTGKGFMREQVKKPLRFDNLPDGSRFLVTKFFTKTFEEVFTPASVKRAIIREANNISGPLS